MSAPRPRRCSKPGSWACSEGLPKHLRRWFASLLTWVLAVAAHADVMEIREAQARFGPEAGGQQQRSVRLPHKWDGSFPGQDGRATYRFELPPPVPGSLMGLYIPRVGNQVHVVVGDSVVLQEGVLGDPTRDAAKAPVLIPLAADVLEREAPTPVIVTVSTQAGRWGGLSQVYYGPMEEVRAAYRERYFWRQYGALATTVAMALMAALAGGLWLMQRESVYGVFALSALCGAVRFSDRLLPEPPLPWPAWGALMALALAWHVLLMTRFLLLLVEQDDARTRTTFWWFFALVGVLAMFSFVNDQPWAWTLALALLAPPTWGAFVLVARHAWQQPRRETVAALAASLLVLVAGFRDFFVVRLSGDGPGTFSILPHASMLFVLLMGWAIAERYARVARAHRELVQTLEARVQERERALQVQEARVREAHAQQAVLLERQRIMQDIHDGVGAQLVGLLSLLGQSGASNAQLQEQARLALDELRMAVDSQQPTQGDLGLVLATLRYRLQPRFEAAGLQVQWDMGVLPPMPAASPRRILQLQRILLEAFTNVIRHADATRLAVDAEFDAGTQALRLRVQDDGRGFDAEAAANRRGQGLRNMQARAQSIGAQIRWARGDAGRGTSVEIRWPLAAVMDADGPQVPPT